MVLLLFQANGERLGLDVAGIVEVVPPAAIEPASMAAPGVAGLLNYHGSVVPVIDLAVMLGGAPARLMLSTRIVLARYPKAAGGSGVLGLLVERATETLRVEEHEFQSSVVATGGPQRNGVVVTPDGLVQRITVAGLLSKELEGILLPGVA